MFKPKTAFESFFKPTFQKVENNIENSLQATPKEIEKVAGQLRDQFETFMSEKIEAQIRENRALEHRRNLLSETLQDAEEQQKYTPY